MEKLTLLAALSNHTVSLQFILYVSWRWPKLVRKRVSLKRLCSTMTSSWHLALCMTRGRTFHMVAPTGARRVARRGAKVGRQPGTSGGHAEARS